LIEPVLIYLEIHLRMDVVMAVECAALLIQSIGMLVSLLLLPSAELVTAYGQLLFAMSSLIGYWTYAFWWNPQCARDIWPRSFRISQHMYQSLKGFLVPAAGKYIAAEGEHLVLFFFASAQQQGVYEFVFNLGSLIPRIVFLPIEKTAFAMFSNFRTSSSSQVTTKDNGATTATTTTNNNNNAEQMRVWRLLMNVSTLISLTYLATCPTYIHFLVHLVYGAKWSNTEAPTLLGVYGVYLLLIGINGLVEAARDALVPSTELQRQNAFVVLSVALHLAFGTLGLYFVGALGLLFAACVTTLLRCMFNVVTFERYSMSLLAVLPDVSELVVYATILGTGQAARLVLGDSWKLIGFGVVQGVFYVAWLFVVHRKKLVDVRKMVHSNKLD
jgi:oligosaccharide translocation protein RFT1